MKHTLVLNVFRIKVLKFFLYHFKGLGFNML